MGILKYEAGCYSGSVNQTQRCRNEATLITYTGRSSITDDDDRFSNETPSFITRLAQLRLGAVRHSTAAD